MGVISVENRDARKKNILPAEGFGNMEDARTREIDRFYLQDAARSELNMSSLCLSHEAVPYALALPKDQRDGSIWLLFLHINRWNADLANWLRKLRKQTECKRCYLMLLGRVRLPKKVRVQTTFQQNTGCSHLGVCEILLSKKAWSLERQTTQHLTCIMVLYAVRKTEDVNDDLWICWILAAYSFLFQHMPMVL